MADAFDNALQGVQSNWDTALAPPAEQKTEPRALDQRTLKAFEDSAVKYNVPVDVLMAMAEKDSGFDATARSPGLGPKTRGIIKMSDSDVQRAGSANPYVPEQNIDYAAAKLRGLMASGNLSVPDAVKAFAAGGSDPAQWGPDAHSYAADVLARTKRLKDTYYPPQPEPAPAEPAPEQKPDGSLAQDALFQTTGAINKGLGETVRGAGEAVAMLGDYTTTPILNKIFGREGKTPNALDGAAGALEDLGKKGDSFVSDDTKKAIKDSSPSGDLFKPSTWTLGKNPSLKGYTALGLDLFGGMLPILATAAIAPEAALGVGGAMGGGGASSQARDTITKMAETPADPANPSGPKQIEKESSYYRQLVADGKSPEQALNITRLAAERYAFMFNAPISAVGGAIVGKALHPVGEAAGKTVAGRVLTAMGIPAAEMGAQNPAASVATKVGINEGAGTNQDVTEGTFGDFITGVVSGALPGAAGAARAEHNRPSSPEEIAAFVDAAKKANKPGLPQPDQAPPDESAQAGSPPPDQPSPAGPTGNTSTVTTNGRSATAGTASEAASALNPAPAAPANKGPLSSALETGSPAHAAMADIVGKRVTLTDKVGQMAGHVTGQDADGVMFRGDDGNEQLISHEDISSGKVTLAESPTAPKMDEAKPLPPNEYHVAEEAQAKKEAAKETSNPDDDRRVPVQNLPGVQGVPGGIPWAMHRRAYDAYSKKFGEQRALLDERQNYRGGFGPRELDEYIPGWREELSAPKPKEEAPAPKAEESAAPEPKAEKLDHSVGIDEDKLNDVLSSADLGLSDAKPEAERPAAPAKPNTPDGVVEAKEYDRRIAQRAEAVAPEAFKRAYEMDNQIAALRKQIVDVSKSESEPVKLESAAAELNRRKSNLEDRLAGFTGKRRASPAAKATTDKIAEIQAQIDDLPNIAKAHEDDFARRRDERVKAMRLALNDKISDRGRIGPQIAGALKKAKAEADAIGFERGADEAKAAEPGVERPKAEMPPLGRLADEGFKKFPAESGTLGIPRAEMPQVPTEAHGALVNHLNAQGIAHKTGLVYPEHLTPTQAEFSPEKVEKAKDAEGDRSIIVANDGHIIDGHHQALAAKEEGKPVKAIVLDAPVKEALEAVKNSPSAQKVEPAPAPGPRSSLSEAASANVTQHVKPQDRSHAEMSSDELREKLTYLRQQAKSASGWTKPLINERAKIENELASRGEPPKSEAAPAPKTEATEPKAELNPIFKYADDAVGGEPANASRDELAAYYDDQAKIHDKPSRSPYLKTFYTEMARQVRAGESVKKDRAIKLATVAMNRAEKAEKAKAAEPAETTPAAPADRSFTDRVQDTASTSTPAAVGPDGRGWRVKKEGEGFVVVRMPDQSKPGSLPKHYRPEDGKTWTADEAARFAANEAYKFALAGEGSEPPAKAEKPTPITKAESDQPPGTAKKREVALARIAGKGAWFGKREGAEKFITEAGLSDTHEITQTGKSRFDVVAKAKDEPKIEVAPNLAGGTPVAEAAAAAQAKSDEKGRKLVGKNEAGKELWEDGRGVRSYVEDGVRHTETVGFIPQREGPPKLETNRINRRGFTTVEEDAERKAKLDEQGQAWKEGEAPKGLEDRIKEMEATRDAIQARIDGQGQVADARDVERLANVKKVLKELWADRAAEPAEQEFTKGDKVDVQTRTGEHQFTGTVVRVANDGIVVRNDAGINLLIENPARVSAHKDDAPAAQPNEQQSALADLQSKLPDGYTAKAGENGYYRVEGPNGYGIESREPADILKDVKKEQRKSPRPAPKTEAPEGAKAKAEQPKAEKPKAEQMKSDNTAFTDDAYAAAKARFEARHKGRMNSGIDPEDMMDGIIMAGYHIEKGARTFAAYAKAMVQELGEHVKPYLKSWYMGVKYDPRAAGFEGMDGEGAVSAFDVNALKREAENETNGQGDNLGDREGVSPTESGPGDAPQHDSGRGNQESLEGGKPDNVGEAATGGDDGKTGVRGPTKDVGGNESADKGGDAGNGRKGNSGKGKPDDGTGEPQSGPVTPEESEKVSPGRPGASNFHMDNPLEIVGGGPVARFDKNMAAIKLYNALRDEGRPATPEEMRTLAGYTGWGSFGQELFQGTWERPMHKPEWEDRGSRLRDHLGQEEWESAQRSITNAHYTDPPTVMAMWNMMKRLGFGGGRILEPAMGIGNFFGMMPKDLQDRSKLSGIELDELTGGMAKLLYPDANVQIMSYVDSKTPDNFHDIAIGNWPFENTVIADRRYNRVEPVLHDYFFLKTLDQVRPGGIVMGITSNGTMDKQATRVRATLAKNAELIAAIRLPSGAFQEYAGTKVVTDIVILRKRESPLALVPTDAGWIKSVKVDTPSGTQVSINEYFAKNPQNIIGTTDFGHGTTRGRPGMIVNRPENMAERLKEAVNLVPEKAYQKDEAAKQISYVSNHTSDREGSLTAQDGKLFVVRGEHLAPANEVVKYEVKDAKATAGREAELQSLIDMRRKYGQLIDAERNGRDAEPARAALKSAFDAFVSDKGKLGDSFGLKYLQKIGDPFYPALASLEINGNPAAILSRSTMRGTPKMDNPSITDAFVLSRNGGMVSPRLEDIAALAKKPEAEVRAELVKSGAVFETPTGDIVPSDIYLSGNVREKLRQAQAAVETNPAMAHNVEALKAVQPKDIPYFRIETQMGATWVPPASYRDYVAHMLNHDGKGIDVSFRNGRWKINLPDGVNHSAEAQTGFGTGYMPFSKLVNYAIGNQVAKVTTKDENGNDVLDPKGTEEANARIEKIRKDFGEWLWSDPERRVSLEKEYNEATNSIAKPKFDGSFLTFPGMALQLGKSPFDLRKHQADAIWRALVNRRSINAHEVGTGKTFTMGGIAVESRRFGIAKKPMILAHNANSKSVATEIQQMYPSAKVLYLDNLSPDSIDVKMRQIANDDWDAIVVPHSVIDRMSFREDTLMHMAQEQIDALEDEAMEAAKEDGVTLTHEMMGDDEAMRNVRSPTAKDLVRSRNRIIQNIRKQAQRSSREGAMTFEDSGIDMLLVDEIHVFKKPPIATRMRIKGLNTDTSARSIQLKFMTDYTRAHNGGGNVHTFTGTPVTNTLTEVFHQMRYVMEDEMKQAGIADWDGWFASFAREFYDVEMNSAGEFEGVSRLAAFLNVPELRRMIGQYMDTIFADDMPEMQPRPTKSGKTLMSPDLTEAERRQLLDGRTEGAMDRPYKKVVNITSDMTEPQMSVFRRLQQYTHAWRNMGPMDRKKTMSRGDPESPIITEGLAAKASFDVRLLDDDLAGMEGKTQDDPGSKISKIVANVKEIYDSHPLANQVVFAGMGFADTVERSLGRDESGEKRKHKVRVFSTMKDLVARLVQSGIPKEQIALVDGSTSKDKRKEIADAMNTGAIRIVIGNTSTLGVGVNMQRNLRAMHHSDAPYMPGDLEQRNGRGHRQGNQWNTVLEYRYLTDRLDGRRWQILAKKESFIKKFLKGDDSEQRVLEGEAADDEESSIMQSFSEAAGDPRLLIKEKMKKIIERLQTSERTHVNGIADARQQMRWEKGRFDEGTRDLANIDKNGTIEKAQKLISDTAADAFSAELEGTKFDKRKDFDAAYDALAQGVGNLGDTPRKIGRFGGYDLMARWPKHYSKPELYVDIDGNQMVSMSGIGGVEGSARRFPKRVEDYRANVEKTKSTIDRLQEVSEMPFGRKAELIDADKKLLDLEKDLVENPVPPPSWLRQATPTETPVFWKGKEYTVTGHRYTPVGWFVSADDAKGEPVNIPYDEAKDKTGMNLYEKREFKPPEVIGGKQGAAPAITEDKLPEGFAVESPLARGGDYSIIGPDGEIVATGATKLAALQQFSASEHAPKPSIGDNPGTLDAGGLKKTLTTGEDGGVLSKMIDSGKVVIHDDASTLPAGSPAGLVHGVTTADGTIHLVASNLTPETARSVMLHEAFHSGAEPLVGSRGWKALLDRVGVAADAALHRGYFNEDAESPTKAFWNEAVERATAADTPAESFNEEVAAYIVENYERAPKGMREAIDNFMGQVKAWALRKFGKQFGDVTPAQLHALAVAALRSDLHGSKPTPPPKGGNRYSMGNIKPDKDGKSLFGKAGKRVNDFLTDAMGRNETFNILKLVPVRPLFLELAKGMPAAKHYVDTKQAMDAMRHRLNNEDAGLLDKWSKWVREGLGKKNKAENKELMDLMHESTLAQVDPSMDFVAQFTKEMENGLRKAKKGSLQFDTLSQMKAEDEERGKSHDDLSERYDALSPKAKELYNEVRDAYAERADATEKEVIQNVKRALDTMVRRARDDHAAELDRIKEDGLTGKLKDDAIKNADTRLDIAENRVVRNRAARMKRLRQQFESNRMQGPYFPLARFGNYFVTIRDKAGRVLSFSRFESASEQREFYEEMEKNPALSVEHGALERKDGTTAMPDAKFVSDIDSILEGADAPSEVRDQLWQRYLETLPDLSMRKHRIHRKGRAGYNTDALRAFAFNMFHSAHQLARLRYGQEMQDHIDQARQQVKDTPNPTRSQAVFNEMLNAHNFAMNPKGNPIAYRATSMAFLWTMGWNLSTGLVVLHDPIQRGIPNLAFDAKTGNVGVKKASAALASAFVEVLRGKGSAENSSRLTFDERDAMMRARELGVIENTNAHDLAGVSEAGIDYSPRWHVAMKTASMPLHHAERVNREVTFLAAYRLARAKGMNHAEAVKNAADLTWMSQFDTQSSSKPAIMRNDMGRVMLALRNFHANILYRVFRDAHQSMHGLDPAEKKAAFGRLVSSLLITAGMAGLRGAYFAAYIIPIAAGVMAMAGLRDKDKDPEEQLRKLVLDATGDTMIGRAVGGSLMDGIPGYFTGTAISQRIGVADIGLRSPDREMNPEQAWQYWTEQAFGPSFEIAHGFVKGGDKIAHGEIMRGLEDALPAAARNVLKAGRYAYEGVRDKNGNAIVEHVAPQDIAKQAIGLTPAEVSDRRARNTFQINEQTRIHKEKSEALREAAKSRMAGDSAGIAKAQEKVDHYNERFPEERITPKSVRSEIKRFRSKADRAEYGVDLDNSLSDRINSDTARSIYSRQ